MSSEPGPYKALRAYYNTSSLAIDEGETERLLDESDRAQVVIFAARLEDQLAEAIREKFPKLSPEDEKTIRIFHHDGPLGSFSAKITMSYALGIIDERSMSELNDIRQMRNACAHSARDISFATPELAQVCKRLLATEQAFFQMEQQHAEALRNMFPILCMALALSINEGTREAGTEYLREAFGRLGLLRP